jgi:hypothetical protein
MELDELKNIWRKNDPEFNRKGEAEIAAMLKGKSTSIVEKLKRSVWLELVFTLIAGVALLIYALTLPDGSLKWTSVSILILFVGYTFYYIKKLFLLNQFDRQADNLKNNLEKLVDKLSGYLKFYKRSYTILYPVYFVLGIAFGGLERGLTEFINVLSKPLTIIYLSVLAAVFFFCSTWVVKWLLKKLYGNHLEKLKSLLVELNSYEKAE